MSLSELRQKQMQERLPEETKSILGDLTDIVRMASGFVAEVYRKTKAELNCGNVEPSSPSDGTVFHPDGSVTVDGYYKVNLGTRKFYVDYHIASSKTEFIKLQVFGFTEKELDLLGTVSPLVKSIGESIPQFSGVKFTNTKLHLLSPYKNKIINDCMELFKLHKHYPDNVNIVDRYDNAYCAFRARFEDIYISDYLDKVLPGLVCHSGDYVEQHLRLMHLFEVYGSDTPVAINKDQYQSCEPFYRTMFESHTEESGVVVLTQLEKVGMVFIHFDRWYVIDGPRALFALVHTMTRYHKRLKKNRYDI